MKPGARPPYSKSDLQRSAPPPANGLRNFLIVMWLLVGAFVAYAYSKNPEGCMKVVDDARAVVMSLIPGQTGGSKYAPIVGASIGTTEEVSPSETDSPPKAAAPAPPPPVVVKVFPTKPNWTWITLDGKIYNNVVVTQMDADTVSIEHTGGSTHLPVSMLTPGIKHELGIVAPATNEAAPPVPGK